MQAAREASERYNNTWIFFHSSESREAAWLPTLFATNDGNSMFIEKDGNYGIYYSEIAFFAAAMAKMNPQFFKERVHENEDGTYTVSAIEDSLLNEIKWMGKDELLIFYFIIFGIAIAEVYPDLIGRVIRNNKEGSYTILSMEESDREAIRMDDVKQAGLGDCALMAAMAALAETRPGLIRQMIRDNKDGSYTVTFYQKVAKNTKKLEIRVDDLGMPMLSKTC